MKILYLEPFDDGSHAAFTRVLTEGLAADWTVLTLPGRHWKWHMRASAPHWALSARDALERPHDLVFASAFVPLAELVGLVPALAAVPRVLYFHENQLAYPVRDTGAGAGGRERETDGNRDLHFGVTQMTSALAATRCVFNSEHNRASFLTEATRLLARMPAPVPPGWVEAIAARSVVLPVPLALPEGDPAPDLARDDPDRHLGPIVLWNHRWEHDKAPERFFAALERVAAAGAPFRLAVCGRRYRRAPEVFARARERLADRVVHWGALPDRAAYEGWLRRAHLAVSTAVHEFFGVAVLEATHAGARPLVPDRLAYPELFPARYRYPDDDALVAQLTELCRAWARGERDLRADRRELSRPWEAAAVLPRYRALFEAEQT